MVIVSRGSNAERQRDIEERLPGDLRQGNGSQVLRAGDHIHVQDLEGKVVANGYAGGRRGHGAQLGVAERIALDLDDVAQTDAHLVGVAGDIQQHELVRPEQSAKNITPGRETGRLRGPECGCRPQVLDRDATSRLVRPASRVWLTKAVLSSIWLNRGFASRLATAEATSLARMDGCWPSRLILSTGRLTLVCATAAEVVSGMETLALNSSRR